MLRVKEGRKGSIEEALTKARRFKKTILQEISKLKIIALHFEGRGENVIEQK